MCLCDSVWFLNRKDTEKKRTNGKLCYFNFRPPWYSISDCPTRHLPCSLGTQVCIWLCTGLTAAPVETGTRPPPNTKLREAHTETDLTELMCLRLPPDTKLISRLEDANDWPTWKQQHEARTHTALWTDGLQDHNSTHTHLPLSFCVSPALCAIPPSLRHSISAFLFLYRYRQLEFAFGLFLLRHPFVYLCLSFFPVSLTKSDWSQSCNCRETCKHNQQETNMLSIKIYHACHTFSCVKSTRLFSFSCPFWLFLTGCSSASTVQKAESRVSDLFRKLAREQPGNIKILQRIPLNPSLRPT